MQLLSFKLHDYTDYDNVEICIGGPRMNAEYVNDMLNMAGGAECEFDISSIGGDLGAGINMYDAIKRYGNADTRIGALAASSASLVAMAGRKVKMSKYGLLMIHKPMVGTAGNSDDLQETIDMLNVRQGRIAQIYMDKTGLDEETINALINSTTWLTADQALSLGFIDEVEDFEAEFTNHAIVGKYANTAPAVYQRVFNKLTIAQTQNSMITDKETIDKNTTVLNKIMNFFSNLNKVKNEVVDKAPIFSASNLAVGVAVTNADGEPAEDGDYPVKNADGKQVIAKVVNGIVTNMEGDEDADETADDEDVQNTAILNAASIQVTNKAEVKGVVNALRAKDATIAEQNALIASLSGQLKVSNELVSRDEEKIKADIKSTFEPNQSQRSSVSAVANSKAEDKGGVKNVLNKSIAPTSPTAQAAMAKMGFAIKTEETK